MAGGNTSARESHRPAEPASHERLLTPALASRILQHTHDGVVLLNRDRTVRDVLHPLFGDAETALVGRAPAVHPDDELRAADDFDTLLRIPGHRVTAEYRLRHPVSGYVWVEATLVNLLDDPDVCAVLASYRDIASERRLAVELEEAKQRVTDLLNSITEAFLALDRQFRFTFVSDRIALAIGCSPADLIGKSVWDVFPESKDSPFYAQYHRVMSERVSAKFEVHHRATNTWLEVHAYPAPEGLTAYVIDITDRKRAEHTLHELYQTQRALLRASPLPIVVLTTSGLVTLWNPAAEQVFGWEASEVVGELLPFIPKEKLAEHRAMREQDLRGEGFREREIVRIRKDGVPIHLRVSTAPVYSEDGAVTGIISIYQDITAKKRADQALLEHAEALARSNAELQQFAHVASHDLQEPLRTITAHTQLLTRGQLKPQEASECANYIVAATRRMNDLVNDLLTFGRVNASAASSRRIVDANAAVDIALENLKASIAGTQAVVTRGDLPRVHAHGTFLTLVFQNLISNGIKYTLNGPPRIEIGAEESGHNWVFSVRDHGIGIAPKFHARVFDLCKRLHGQEIPGTGIGLALCKKIVEDHGGSIWVESEAGAGATFRFTMPKEEPALGPGAAL